MGPSYCHRTVRTAHHHFCSKCMRKFSYCTTSPCHYRKRETGLSLSNLGFGTNATTRVKRAFALPAPPTLKKRHLGRRGLTPAEVNASGNPLLLPSVVVSRAAAVACASVCFGSFISRSERHIAYMRKAIIGHSLAAAKLNGTGVLQGVLALEGQSRNVGQTL